MNKKLVKKVFVVDAEGKPLLPTHPARSRKLLKAGRAKVLRVEPFTIQLDRVVENPVGSFTVGVDDGAKFVGIAIVNEFTKECVFGGTIRLRQDVKRKMTQRAQYRRTRRSRKLRHRKPRFLNRGKKGFNPPTIRQKKDSIIRVIKDLQKGLNITKVVVEQGMFDVSSLVAGKKLKGKEYQISDYEGKNFRAKVLWRDKYTCQNCGNKGRLQAHHIIQRRDGGSNSPRNGITLCEKCHDDLHDGKWTLDKKPKTFRYSTRLQQGKNYLIKELEKLELEIETRHGFETFYWRKSVGLEKSHINDAISMVCKDYKPKMNYDEKLILPRRTKVWENNPTKKCTEKNGFMHWDLVRAKHRTRGIVIGSIRSLKKVCITLRTEFDDNFAVSYNKSKILFRFDGIAYI